MNMKEASIKLRQQLPREMDIAALTRKAIKDMREGLKTNYPMKDAPFPALEIIAVDLEDLDDLDAEELLSDLNYTIDTHLLDARLTRVSLVKALMYISHIIDIRQERLQLRELEKSEATIPEAQ